MTAQAAPGRGMLAALRAAADALLHTSVPDAPPWKALPWVLVLAFALRAAVALSGDFSLHPDEVIQYLEPAHRLVFGYGVVYWEYFYGARSYLLPGLIAGALFVFDLLGLGEPFWYIGGVKLFFCAISLGVPAGMYVFARHHFGETTARIALLAGAFWYELAGFAHKPMTEFVGTVSLVVLLACCVRPAADRTRTIWLLAALAVLTSALRVQYAPLALLLLGAVLLRSDRKRHLILASAVCCLAVGVFDAVTWGGGLFHSYLTNIRFNLEYPFGALPYAMPVYQFVWWLLLAGGGLSVLCLAAAAGNLRRYGLLFALSVILLVFHSLQTHKEYRFIFAVLPLWLLLGADLLAALLKRMRQPRRLAVAAAAAAVAFTAISTAGLLNILPYQDQVYRTPFRADNLITRFFPRLHPNIPPIFDAYRYLAAAPGVTGVWQAERYASATPGYYYLHRAVPFYDAKSGRPIARDAETLRAAVSHIVSERPKFAVPGYSEVKTFDTIRILQRDDEQPAVRQWQAYTPHYIPPGVPEALHRPGRRNRVPPPNWGIRFVE